MQSNNKIIELAKKLPFGAKKVIAENLNLHERTIDNILNGKRAVYKNVLAVVNEAKRIIKEYEEIADL